jgi:hypothetical protein
MARDKKVNKKNKKLSPFDGKLSPKDGAGFDNTVLKEKQPHYVLAECESQYPPSVLNNARIVFGRDRNSSISSGYGGKGHTRSGAIDLVVGLQGWSPGENYKEIKKTGEEKMGFADKSFGSMNNGQPGDAARIYISQRADIDKYFDICDGNVGQSIAESAIGMKADSIRIMARKGIKIVTGKNPPGRNSLDGKLNETYGIDLIAGNRDFSTGLENTVTKILNLKQFRPHPLQPIPKGDNLVHFLDILSDNILLLNSVIAGLLMIVPLLSNATLSPKLGIGPTGPISTFPGLTDLSSVGAYLSLINKQMTKLISQQQNMISEKVNCLEHGGKYYINSRHNRTN